jgi:SP family general alpha glucoside:H+ symporter-like MFS transporter
MGDNIEPKSYANDAQIEKAIIPADDSANLDKNAKAADYKLAAMDAEAAEHNMGVIQAVKQYPMAATWAVVMSCTIVSHVPLAFN